VIGTPWSKNREVTSTPRAVRISAIFPNDPNCYELEIALNQASTTQHASSAQGSPTAHPISQRRAQRRAVPDSFRHSLMHLRGQRDVRPRDRDILATPPNSYRQGGNERAWLQPVHPPDFRWAQRRTRLRFPGAAAVSALASEAFPTRPSVQQPRSVAAKTIG